MKCKRLFIVVLYGIYGGQWYCTVYADSEEEAIKKGTNKYDVNKDTWQNFSEHENISTDCRIETELIFDVNGVSNIWFIGW